MIYNGNSIFGMITNHVSSSMNSSIFQASRFALFSGDMNQSFTAQVTDNSDDKPYIICDYSMCGTNDNPYNEYCK